jgi:hypothetical protein
MFHVCRSLVTRLSLSETRTPPDRRIQSSCARLTSVTLGLVFMRRTACAKSRDSHGAPHAPSRAIGLWSYSCRTEYYVPLSQVDDQQSSFDGSSTHASDGQMRGSTSNCQSGRQSNREARIMKATRTDLKRKRCPMAVIKSTVARRTVIRTYWSPVSPDFVP